MKTHSRRNRSSRYRALVMLASAMLFGACAAYGPYHPNTATEPLNSVRGPADGRYKMAFIEFGDQGSALDDSHRAAAITVIRKPEPPLPFLYIHGRQNNTDPAS